MEGRSTHLFLDHLNINNTSRSEQWEGKLKENYQPEVTNAIFMTGAQRMCIKEKQSWRDVAGFCIVVICSPAPPTS